MSKNKKEIIKYAIEELMVKGNLDVIQEVFDPKYIAHAENKKHLGWSFIKKYSEIFQNSIGDIQVIKLEFFNEDENTMVWQRSLQGNHKKNMLGIPASNKTIRWNEMVISKFNKNKISEEWIVSELMGQLLLNAKPKK